MFNYTKASFIQWLINSFIPQNRLDVYQFPIENYLSLNELSLKNLFKSLNENDFQIIDLKFGVAVCRSLTQLARCKISEWTSSDFLRWLINDFLPRNHIERDKFKIETYSNLNDKNTKKLLKKMNYTDFINLDSNYGHLIYEDLVNFNCLMIGNGSKPKYVYRVSKFISDLLQAGRTDTVIWIHKQSYTFKIVNPHEIARLWSPKKKRKHQGSISYDNMERGIRHSKKQGYLSDAPETFKDRYTFSFGKKALEMDEWLRKLNEN